MIVVIFIIAICLSIANDHLTTVSDYDDNDKLSSELRKYSLYYFYKKIVEKDKRKAKRETWKILKRKTQEMLQRLENSSTDEEIAECLEWLLINGNLSIERVILPTEKHKTRHKDLVAMNKEKNYQYDNNDNYIYTGHGEHGSKGQRKWKVFTKSVNKARKQKHSYNHLYPDPAI